MNLDEALRRRRSVRAFLPDPVSLEVLDAVVASALRAPSAGHSQGLDLVVLQEEEVDGYWDMTLSADARSSFPWPGLLRAPVLVVVVTDPAAYVRRYAEPDKAGTGLGAGADAWPVPYWWVDAGMGVENLLLSAVSYGLAACFFGQFDHERAVLDHLGVPPGRRGVGTVALGHPDLTTDRPSRSAGRPRRVPTDAIHHGRW